MVAGHAAARFRFAIPAGLAPLRGVTPSADPAEQLELSAAGPDGVGVADGAPVALSSIVVFSDPLGLGLDFARQGPAVRQQLADLYRDGLRERLPDAGAVQFVQAGAHLGLRIELPRVAMPDRPVRAGRHYLLFDGEATASVDCLWTPAEAARMTRACDEVAGGLVRVSSSAR